MRLRPRGVMTSINEFVLSQPRSRALSVSRSGMALTRTRELRGDGSSRASLRALQACFGRNGYVRVFDPARRNVESSQAYKKGYEVRLIVADARELTQLRRALEAAGVRAGRRRVKTHEANWQILHPSVTLFGCIEVVIFE